MLAHDGVGDVSAENRGTLAVNIPMFNYDSPIASHLFRNRINFERFNKGSRGVRQILRNETIHKRFSISEIKHDPRYPLLCR